MRILLSFEYRYNTSCNGLYSRITHELYRVLTTWIDGKSACTTERLSSTAAATADEAAGAEHSAPRSREITTSRVNLGAAADSLNTLYGALTCMAELGPSCLRTLVFPRLPALCRRLTRMISTSTTTQSNSSDTSAVVMVVNQEGFQQTLNSTSTTATNSLSSDEMRSLDFLKKLMNVNSHYHFFRTIISLLNYTCFLNFRLDL